MSRKADNRPIGVFDSGLGGLTVVNAMSGRLPDEDIIYLGDTARVPYGDKSVDSIIAFAHQDVDFLLRRGVKAVVIACNTVSSVAMDALRSTWPDIHIMGVLEAGIRAVLSGNEPDIAVIGTRATVNSDAYRRGIHALDPSRIVDSIACPLFVPLAEEGLADSALAELAIDLYLSKRKANPPGAMLLGCTHYPLFKEPLNRYFNGRVQIIDSASACAEFVADYLEGHCLSASPGKGSKFSCFVTDMHSAFYTHAARFLNRIPERVEKITLPSGSSGCISAKSM